MQANISVPIEVRDLTEDDLDALRWSGGRSHIAAVRQQLARVPLGLADYLVACAPSGLPVGKAGIEYSDDAGTIVQVAVHPAVQSCGVGTLLIAEAEARIRARGVAYAELAVEHTNPRARTLYERLGYVACGEEPAEWDEDQPDGSRARYHTMCTRMRKPVR